MQTRARLAALAGGLALALVAPVTAQAATKTVDMGTPKAAQKTFNQTFGIDVNDFFPHAVTIHVGDSVRFAPVAFHTVDLAPRGGEDLPLILPTGQKVAGAVDAGGSPFWFNGQNQLGFNPALLKPLYGKTVTFNGRKRVESGLPTGNNLKPMTVRFTRTGTYKFFCDVHPGMQGLVRVARRRAAIPSKRSDSRSVRRMLARDLAIGKALPKATVPSGSIDVGQAGAFGVEYYNFLPNKVTVKAGTTVRFQMSQGSRETHTATAGPGNPATDPNSYLGQLAASFAMPVIDPRAVYPSDPPTALAALTPQSHGNGFWNSGALDEESGTPLPPASQVQFSAPGTYQFYCLIHPFMHGTVTVTP